MATLGVPRHVHARLLQAMGFDDGERLPEAGLLDFNHIQQLLVKSFADIPRNVRMS